MRPFPLTALKGGINRLRTKGGARADQLYDLLNGYVDQAGGIQPREGTIRDATLSSATVGLCVSDGVFHVFAKSLVTVPAGYECNALVHPTNAALDPVYIWFVKPFMGFLYVVAQFSDGSIYHYWLQSSGTWKASSVWKNSDIVLPTTLNGLAYQAVRNSAVNPTWSTQTAVTLNMVVEPTTYTGYAYKATAVAGTSPHTGSVEPAWPTVTGGTVQEFGDFSTSSTASGDGTASTGEALSSTITDRYGNSSTVAGQAGTASSISTSVAASTDVTTWAPGTLYPPGSVTQPSTSQGAFINAIPNGDFENGSDGNWTLAGSGGFVTSNQYQGIYAYQLTAANSVSTVTMTNYGTVTAGQSVTASAYVNPNNPGNSGADLTMNILLKFYDSSNTLLSTTAGPNERMPGYRKTSVTAVAPVGATRARVAVQAGNGTSSKTGFLDLVVWDLEQPAAVSNFIYEAVQATTLSSGTTEPVWPTIAGNTVVDNGVVWKAIGTSIVTWTAIPIMQSGATEPTWPLVIGQAVNDGTMSWRAINRQVNVPNPSTAVALAASHVFNGDNDIVGYSAAVDPTDWVSTNNAGYLPTGLNNYGDNPVSVLALYRSNLMAFNAGGYQMWQVDPDPANMAILDAQPIGSVWPRAAQSVSNNLLFLTEVGVRDIGTVGATANMQIGGLGQPVDPIVVAQMKLGTYAPISLYYPGRGQYWLIFGPQAFVLTMSGNNQRAWSRYIFPAAITDWALDGGDLYLRTSTNLVWRVDSDTTVDDFGGADVGFKGVMQWPYLDCGQLGINKMMYGLDVVGDGSVSIQIGYNERDTTTFSDNPGFATSTNVTPPYSIAMADTQPGQPLPFGVSAQSFSLILTFDANQKWSWQAANLYMVDSSGGGATG
jgi:hypothetical protein